MLILDLLGLVLGLLKAQLGVLRPLFEFSEVVLEFAEECAHFTLVIALARGGELAFFDRDRQIRVLGRHVPSILFSDRCRRTVRFALRVHVQLFRNQSSD